MSQQPVKVASVQLNVMVPEDLKEALLQQAEVEDRSVARVVRRALRQYLDGRKSPQEKAA